jgi:replicative DNA helicase
MNLENVILESLLFNETFGRKVAPFLKTEYFAKENDQLVFELVGHYFERYNGFPPPDALLIELDGLKDISEKNYSESKSLIGSLTKKETTEKETEWLIDKTEEWCKNRALELALRKAIGLADAEDNKNQITKGAIPQILSDALGVSFDTVIGHDYLEDVEERWKYYHEDIKKIPFHIDILNTITNDGIYGKTLNMLMAGVHVGKSMAMCSFAAHNLMQGLNVLYVTLELRKEEVARRIDANFLDINLNDVVTLPKLIFTKGVEKFKEKTQGKLIIKEYPGASIGAGHLRHLLNEIKTKKNIKIDILYVDYLNLCISTRFKKGASGGSYEYIKSVAEELRGLAQEQDIPIWSATQVNRTGFTDSDFGMEHTSESFGLPATCDLFLAMITTDDLRKLNQIKFKQLKNRYGDVDYFNKFMVGVDYPKMRLYNTENSAQDDVLKNAAVRNVEEEDTKRLNSKFEEFIV